MEAIYDKNRIQKRKRYKVEKKEWTGYKYDGKCFIVTKNEQWVGIYNMDSIISIIVK